MDRDKIIEILKEHNVHPYTAEEIAEQIKALEPNADEIEKACIDFVKRTGYKGKGQKVLAHTIYRWGANFVKNFKR